MHVHNFYAFDYSPFFWISLKYSALFLPSNIPFLSTMALANLILHTINTKDERIMQITLQEEMDNNDNDESIQTRSKSS